MLEVNSNLRLMSIMAWQHSQSIHSEGELRLAAAEAHSARILV